MKKLPEEFCVKANQEHELWKEYIQWLNEGLPEVGGLYGDANGYYGVRGLNLYFNECNWGKVITLEQWHEAVNAKSEFPEPVFITKSGVEIYDEAEMLVWNDDEAFSVPRRVIAKSMTGIWVGIHVGLRFTVFDSTGVQNWGRITAIAGDGKSFTAAATGAASFTVGASVEVMFTNYNLDHCECPPAIAIKNWAPTFGNTLVKDGVAVEYCAETMQEEGMLFDHIPTPRGEVSVDTRLNDALKLHTQRLEHSFAFDKQLTEGEATSAGSIAQGTNGVFTILEGRATKVEGPVETMDDVNLMVSILKKNKIREATMYCTAAQFTALQELFPTTSAYHIDPFVNHETDLVYFGFAGFKINGVTIRFKEWSALDDAGDFVGLKYNFVIVPEGRLRRVINGQTENVGYLNAAYYTIDGKVMKMLRQDQVGNGGYCGVDKISYLTKVAPVVFMANKFILGVAGDE